MRMLWALVLRFASQSAQLANSRNCIELVIKPIGLHILFELSELMILRLYIGASNFLRHELVVQPQLNFAGIAGTDPTALCILGKGTTPVS